MKVGFLEFVAVILIASLCSLNAVFGIRFTITIEECFSHDVKYEGDRIHVSFVVIKVNSGWPSIHEGVDLVVKGPSGDQIHVSRDRISEKFWFLDNKKGAYRFCFRNKSPNQETVDFDLHESHFSYHDQHAKDEHLEPLFEQLSRIDEALLNIQCEQHWLEALADRQSIVNKGTSHKAVHKALYEAAALIGGFPTPTPI